MPGDPYILGAAAAGIVALLVVGWLFLSVRGDREETQVALDEAVQDSLRFADVIARTNQLTARRDSIAQRVSIIQEIDAGRFTWPHVLDEVARALPDYTWLREMTQVEGDPLQIRITGRAGSNFAITNFMRNLEASRFLREVRLERSEQSLADNSPSDLIYQFELTVTYESPPLDELETVPLFEGGVAQLPASDTTGG
jgi:Tfp pilus assembly protein PilN